MKIKLENTYYKIIFASLFTAISIITLVTCSQSTEPKPPDYKDPREMTWTTDTLEFPGAIQTLMRSIWASSPNDVHVIGHCDEDEGSYWHFNGTTWNNINLFNHIRRGALRLNKIWGIAENDFWILGQIGIFEDESLILHYNGQWHDYISVSNALITDISGLSSDKIWLTGSDGIIIHGYYESWQIDTVTLSFPPNTSYANIGIGMLNNELFIIGVARNPYISLNNEYFIKGNLDNWRIVDSAIIQNSNWGEYAKWGSEGIFQTTDGKLFSYGLTGIWKWNDYMDQWEKTYTNNSTIRGLQGVDSNYLFATADFGRLFYFDGTEWMTITNIIANQENIHFYDVWTDGIEIFVLGHITDSFPMRTIVLHGK